MLDVVSDLRVALRQLVRQRALALVAVSSLAVGISVSAAISTIAAAVLVQPLPYESPEELVMVWDAPTRPTSMTGFRDPRTLVRRTVTPTTVLQWRDRALPLADFAVLESWETDPASRFDMREGGAVERLRGTQATTNVFELLGVHAVLGRTFTEHESHDVAVISGRLWRSRFGRDPGVLGRMLTLDTGRGDDRMPRPVEIIGVLPERFHFTYPEETEIWLPLTWTDIEQEVPFAVVYRAVARLRPDTPLQAVQAAMQPFRESGGPPGTRIWLEPVHDYAVGASRGALITSGPVWIMVRAHAPASQVTADIRRIVLDVYPAEPIGRITTLDAILDASVSDRRAYALIGGAFALVVLGLSGLGLSGHLSHVVAERTRDIAIRSALGASPRQQRRVLVEHVVPALAVGLTAALLGSYLLFPFFSSFLFQVDRVDVIANAIGVCVVLAVTGGAVALSARRLEQIEVAHVLNESQPRHASELQLLASDF